jgi:hypothetical protein
MSTPVFVIYSPNDRQLAVSVAAVLTSLGVQPNMEWEVETDGLWSEAMEKPMDAAAACVMLIGPSGQGPANSMDMRMFLARQAAKGAMLLPILLPGAEPAEVPLFLQGHPIVDLRLDPNMSTLPHLLRESLNHRV